MQINRLARVVAAAALGASIGLAAAAPAMANSTISINPGNVPTQAQAYQGECDFGGGPYADKDVWIFNLPSNGGAAGDFVSITAQFDTNGAQPGGLVTRLIDGDSIVRNGTSKGFAITDTGWTLVGATAEITGTADKFVLTHTCIAHPTPTTSASTPPPDDHTPGCEDGSTAPECTPGGDTPGCEEGSTAPECNPGGDTPGCEEGSTAPECNPGGETPGCEEGSTAPECNPSPAPSCSTPMPGGGIPSPCQPGGSGGGSEAGGGGLALTGAAVSSIAVGGLALIGTGAALMIRRRRKFVA